MKIIDKFFGRTELAYAIVSEDITTALSLIEICDDINQTDKRKYTYLHFAAQMELFEVIDALISKGATIDARTSTGGTPLRMAVVRCKAYPLDRSIKVIKEALIKSTCADCQPNFLSGKAKNRRNPDGFQGFLTQPGGKFGGKTCAGIYSVLPKISFETWGKS